MVDKWYYSPFANFLGIGLAVGLGLTGLGLSLKYSHERIKIDAPVLQEMDINDNGIPDKFYLMNGKIAVTELDGRPFSISLDAKFLEKER